MARPVGDREAMERALPAGLSVALERALELLDIDAAGWHEAPGVAVLVETVAFCALVGRLSADPDVTVEQARIDAGLLLGVNERTVLRRLDRWRARAAAASTNCRSTSPPSGARVDQEDDPHDPEADLGVA